MVLGWCSTLLSLALLVADGPPPPPQAEGGFAQEFPWFVDTPEAPVASEILVDPDWMLRHTEDRRVVPADVRSAASYAAGHLPGAIHLDLPEEPGTASVRDLLAHAGIGEDDVLVLYGSEADRSSIGRAFLSLAEFVQVKVLTLDYDRWSRSGRAVETNSRERQPRPPASLAPLEDSPWIDRDELLAVFGREGSEILDLRDPGGWGEKYAAPPAFAAGHIPSALPFDVTILLPASGWPEPSKAREVLTALGPRASERVDPEATFILYGDGPRDPRLGLGYLLLKMMGFSARVFSPGFSGWAGDTRHPIVSIVDVRQVRELVRREASDRKAAAPGDAILLDLREDWDYDEGHLPGAVSLPDRLFLNRFDTLVRKHWPKADPAITPIVFYCYGRECIRSRRCATLAAQKGYRKLLWFREGWTAWEQAREAAGSSH